MYGSGSLSSSRDNFYDPTSDLGMEYFERGQRLKNEITPKAREIVMAAFGEEVDENTPIIDKPKYWYLDPKRPFPPEALS